MLEMENNKLAMVAHLYKMTIQFMKGTRCLETNVATQVTMLGKKELLKTTRINEKH